MSELDAGIYPAGPSAAPTNLLAANPRQTRLIHTAFIALVLYIAIYLGATFGLIGYAVGQLQRIAEHQSFSLVVLVVSTMLSVLMLKSIWFRPRRPEIKGIPVTKEAYPQLWEFIHQVARDVAAPEPRRIYLTADVNAAVVYELSWINLFWPAKKDLILGAPLLNLLTLTELKSVLAHEFGHFAQKTSVMGRWVYMAQQIVGRFTHRRDAFDELLRRMSAGPRTAFGGLVFMFLWGWVFWLMAWILRIIIWSLRAIFDSLSRLLLLASRALDREQELQADRVAVSVTGSDAIVQVLWKLPAIEQTWRETINMARAEAGRNRPVKNLLNLQSAIVEKLRFILDDPYFASVPPAPAIDGQAHRVFPPGFVHQSQMWGTHPTHADREENAKRRYVACAHDDRSAWLLFDEPEQVGDAVTSVLTSPTPDQPFLDGQELQSAVDQRYGRRSLQPEYNGCYLGRMPMRGFASADDVFLPDDVPISVEDIYPVSLKTSLREINELARETATLEGFRDGVLEPADGVIRYRGTPIRPHDLQEKLEELARQKAALEGSIHLHDQQCRTFFQRQAVLMSRELGSRHRELVQLWHYATHVSARLLDVLNVLDNTYAIAAADGKISTSERRRLAKVLDRVYAELSQVHGEAGDVHLCSGLTTLLGIRTWSEALGSFTAPIPMMTNLGTWLPQGRAILQRSLHCFSMLRDATLDYLLDYEARIDSGEAPAGSDNRVQVPTTYDTLLAGKETPLQRKLDWWSRFQLAQGRVAEASRALVSIVVAGTALFLIELDSTGTFDLPEYRSDRTDMREVGKLCEGQVRSECVRRAIAYFGGSASRFVSLLDQGCRRNDFRNCGFLGTMYQAGDGVPADINQARTYLEKGCSGSDAQSCNMLAILMASESAPESWQADAIAYFRKACDLQEPHGCLNLASRLMADPYGSPTRAEAVALLERACQGGVTAACEWDMIRFDVQQVGRLCQGRSWVACFDVGSDYMASPSKLIELLEADCEQGHALSCQFLGIVFGARELPLQDPVRSRSYLQKACSGGLQQAC